MITPLLLLSLACAAHADMDWRNNNFDPPRYRTAEEACYLGQMKPVISSYRQSETNPTVRFRIAAMYIGPDQGIGERVCRGDIERTYSNIWVTLATVDTSVFGPNGSADACNIAGYSDADTGHQR